MKFFFYKFIYQFLLKRHPRISIELVRLHCSLPSMERPRYFLFGTPNAIQFHLFPVFSSAHENLAQLAASHRRRPALRAEIKKIFTRRQTQGSGENPRVENSSGFAALVRRRWSRDSRARLIISGKA